MKKSQLIGSAVLFVILGAGVALGTYLIERLPREQITSMEVEAVITTEGDAVVVETIRWDFDTARRRGIIRDIPYSAPASRRGSTVVPVRDVAVASPSAPDQFAHQIEIPSRLVSMRIGDPNRTITGEHDYRIAYRLVGLADERPDGASVSLNIIGSAWEVPIADASVSLTVPGPVSSVDCRIGSTDSTRRCPPPDVVAGDRDTLVSLSGVSLDALEGITITIDYEPSAPPRPPVTDAVDAYMITRADTLLDLSDLQPRPPDPQAPANLGALLIGFPLLTLVGAGGSWALWRRTGRDRRWAGSSVNAVFAGEGPEESVSDGEAASLVTIAFAPPRGVAPGEAGALWRLRSNETDRVATLVDLAVRGWVSIDETDPKKVRIVWSGAGTDELRPWEQAFLDGVFKGQPVRVLGTYSSTFATTWSGLGGALDAAVAQRGWWRAGERARRVRATLVGLVLVLAGLAWCALLAWGRVPTNSDLGWAVGFPGVLVVGLGLGAWATRGGQRARSAEGFSVWAQVEGFRQFMAGSEGEHAREAAQRGVLRQYVAWAVVLGEVDRWEKACAAAGVDPTEGWLVGSTSLHGGMYALRTTSAASRTAPSSSGGGGGGGSVGGGGGGGGGRSW